VPIAVRPPFLTAQVAFWAAWYMLAGWQTREIDIQYPTSLWWPLLSQGLPFASVDVTNRRTELLEMPITEMIQAIRDGGLLSEAGDAPCPCSCSIRSNARIDLRDGMAVTHQAYQACE
jgi:hypothetical protein